MAIWPYLFFNFRYVDREYTYMYIYIYIFVARAESSRNEVLVHILVKPMYSCTSLRMLVNGDGK